MKLFQVTNEQANTRFSLETSSDFPNSVFMHSSSRGFTFCNSFKKQQAIDLAAALVDFATDAEIEEVAA